MAYGTITNTILDPSGTAVPNVVVNARLMPGAGFLPSTYYEMSQLESTITDINGAWSLTLEVNTDIMPGDSYYEIEELIPASAGVPTVWSVQVAAGSHTLYASLVATPPSVSVPSYITQSSADARYIQTGGDVGGNIQPVGTATITGTATVGAPANHAHALSPAVVGSGLTLTAGVLSTSGPGSVSGPIQAVGTATITGTATNAASANHQHPLSPAVAGSGLTLAAGVLLAATQGALIQAVGTMTVTGTATTWAADNHAHTLSPAVAGTGLTNVGGVLNAALAGSLIQAVGTSTATGTSTAFARENHVHELSPAVAGSGLSHAAGVLSVTAPVVLGGAQDITAVNTATATGTTTTVAASNHQHNLSPSIISNGLLIASGVVSANYGGQGDIAAINTATATGTTTTLARANHQHALAGGIVLPSNMSSTAYGADIKNVSTATATGAATTFARSDHQHGIDAGIVGTGLSLTGGVLSATGAAFTYGDGVSDIASVSTTTSTGTATSVARSNHVHTLNPAVAGSGLALTTGVLSAANLTDSNATANYLFVQTNTATTIVGIPQGKLVYNSNSTNLSLFNGAARVVITPNSTNITTSETTTGTSYGDLTTPGPAVTILTGTKALVIVGAHMGNGASAPNDCYMSYAVSGATTIAAADATCLAFANGSVIAYLIQASYVSYVSTLTAGLNTFTAKYRVSGGTGTFFNRNITVIPLP